MDINKIFGAFSSSRDDDGDDFPQVTFLYSPKVDNENHPRYFIKMFTKLVLNNVGFNKRLADFFNSSDAKLDVNEIAEAGEMMLYNRALGYLEQIDLQDEYHIRILFEEAKDPLQQAINQSIKHFEVEEEYEKCAKLKKYLDFLNFSS